jgi:hypothetical protein
MPRILTDDHDEHGQHRPRHGDHVDELARRERLPRGSEDETGWHARCSMCHRPREAFPTCPVCGDEFEDAA